MELGKSFKDMVAKILPDPDKRARTQAEGQLIAATGVALGWQREAVNAAELAAMHTATVRGLLDQCAEEGILNQLDPAVVQNAANAILGRPEEVE
jgi:hypothetical protein